MEAGGCARTGAGSGRPVLLAQGPHGAAMVWCCTISSSRTRAAEDVHWCQTSTMGNTRSMAGRHRDTHPPAPVCSEKSAPAVSDATTPTAATASFTRVVPPHETMAGRWARLCLHPDGATRRVHDFGERGEVSQHAKSIAAEKG